MVHLSALWHQLVETTRDNLVVPLLSRLHVPPDALDARDMAASLLIAALQIGVIGLVFRPLESWRPAERWADRRLTRVDRGYTLLTLLGAAPLAIFLALTPLRDLPAGGVASGLLTGVPWFAQYPYTLFVVYYLAFDCAYYWMHRAEHAIPWWWALHSLHHSQRQLNCWSNDRDCVVSGMMEALILASVGVVLGVEPSEFALLMFAGELVQSLSHTNVRIGFGRLVGKLLVSPDFHRLHHMRTDPLRPGLHHCNFAQAFPLWDILFGTALYGEAPRPTGVGDPVVDADNGLGLLGQQRAALRRFWGAVSSRAGWKPGDVSFGPGYQPIADKLQASPASRV